MGYLVIWAFSPMFSFTRRSMKWQHRLSYQLADEHSAFTFSWFKDASHLFLLFSFRSSGAPRTLSSRTFPSWASLGYITTSETESKNKGTLCLWQKNVSVTAITAGYNLKVSLAWSCCLGTDPGIFYILNALHPSIHFLFVIQGGVAGGSSLSRDPQPSLFSLLLQLIWGNIKAS